ncbi:MAG TPA: transposase [Kiritimatiellia bacterium]|nr:transposase [Kiritimatiellia bacterium]
MRTSRIKVDDTDTWYHCYNRTAGTSQDRPFRDADKEQFVRILHRVSQLYGIGIIAYQVMSNHYHLLVHAPREVMSPEDMCRRYKVFHRDRKDLNPDSELCRLWQQRARDISWFMRHLQQLFTMWYNRSRPLRRRGSLWADRFKHTILESGSAVWACWNYIENNPVRAGMVEKAGDYRFSSYGVWHQSGKHPFADQVAIRILPMLGLRNLTDLFSMMSALLDKQASSGESHTSVNTISRRIRYWVDGLVIGSELFVRTVMSTHHPQASCRRIMNRATDEPPLACWRRPRPER